MEYFFVYFLMFIVDYIIYLKNFFLIYKNIEFFLIKIVIVEEVGGKSQVLGG